MMGVSKTNMFARNWRSKLKAKNGTKRVAVRALNFSTRPFCMKFQGGSNRDGPEGHNPQKWAKTGPKIFGFGAEFFGDFWGCAQSKETVLHEISRRIQP